MPKIGAFVLETLTTGMYTNPLDSIREFIQNATDSIRNAEDKKLISEGEGRIEIKINPERRLLMVRDNGTGIPHEEIYDLLINIGMSNKRIETDAGFRGIGRLAGIAYCKTLYFRTSAVGESVISTIALDCEEIRKAISPAFRQVEELATIIAKNCKIGRVDGETDEHFFEVVLDGIAEAASDFLDCKKLEKYLGQVAPVKYDAQRFIFAPKIIDWIRKNHLSNPSVNLVIKAPGIERQVFKAYKTNYKTRAGDYKVEIKDICFYPETKSSELGYWLWYSKTDLLGMIDDEQVAGLRFRKNNIALGGSDRVAELFAEDVETNRRFNAYYIGEIHIISPQIIPNARRDGFEENDAWQKLKADLKLLIKILCDEIRKLSQDRNRPTQKIVSTANATIKEANACLQTGFASLEERDNLVRRLIKEEERATNAFESRKNPEDSERIKSIIDQLKKARNEVEKANYFISKKLSSSLDRKQRKIIQEILDILYNTIDKENYEKAKAAILAKYKINDNEKS